MPLEPDDGISLGLAHGHNRLVPHDPRWQAAFETERARLAAALGPVARGIEHYGSTAVPGLPAKPIIDILVGVSPLADWERCHDPLLALGYDYAENAGVPGHHIFGRGRDRTERTHLVHVVEFGGESWRSNLAFRDALRADAALRADYLALKTRAIDAAPQGRAAYNALKGKAIARMKAGLRY
jgi:GrpB-like predicted nucleotidyltransferase (UPF0157 family)